MFGEPIRSNKCLKHFYLIWPLKPGLKMPEESFLLEKIWTFLESKVSGLGLSLSTSHFGWFYEAETTVAQAPPGKIPWIRESNVRLTADERWLKITLFVDLVHFLTQLLDVSLNLIKLIQFWIQWNIFRLTTSSRQSSPIFCPPFVADKLHIVIQSVAHFDASWRILPCGGCQAQLDL